MSETNDRPIPVTVVTGFLGAGKTTLVNQLLAGVGRGDYGVIVNEHGDIGIDGDLVAARVEALVEITGGCVCCATQAELARALASMASSPAPPERILVETSGAASPAGVIHVVRGAERRGSAFLDGVITVVDASRIDAVDEHDLAVEQIGYADVIVASRSDLCDAAQRAKATERIAAHNAAALVACSARGVVEDVSLATLDALLARRRDFGGVMPAPAPRPRAAHPYASVSLVVSGDLDGERFADFMETEVARFAGRIFRTKGILAVDGMAERMIVQGVADEVEVVFGEPWGAEPRTSRFVVVGYGLERDALERAFVACLRR